MRTFARCLPNLHWFVFRHFPGASFFVSTVADDDAPSAELLQAKYPAQQVEIEVVPLQPVLPLPDACPPEESWRPGQPFMHEPFAISVPPQAVLRQLWQLGMVYQLFSRTTDVGEFEAVIRIRPDLYFHGARLPKEVAPFSVHTPWWGRFGGVNDRFAIMGAPAAQYYFNTVGKVHELVNAGCPLHPESLVAAAIHAAELDLNDRLPVEFSTIRRDSARPPEVSHFDIAHAGLR
jgi:hypothetical protein